LFAEESGEVAITLNSEITPWLFEKPSDKEREDAAAGLLAVYRAGAAAPPWIGPVCTAMSVEQNKAVSKRWHEAWGTPKIKAAYEECLAPEFRALFFGQGWVDRAKYIEGDQTFLSAFADIRITVEEIVGENDLVICRLRWRARHVGPILGIEATGRDFDVGGFAQDRFRDGRVIEHIPLFDQAGLMRQLQRA